MFARGVIVGAGAMGRWVAETLAEPVGHLAFVDRAPMAGALRWDVIERAPEAVRLELADADLVVCALPDRAVGTALATVVRLVRPSTLVVETSSVKSWLTPFWTAELEKVAFLGINPMFAPSLDRQGRSVLALQHGPSAKVSAFLDLLTRRGMVVVPVANIDEHDRLTAVTQAAVHASVLAFGLVASASGKSAETILTLAPPPCRTLLRLVARMGDVAPEVYSDVQSGNPHAATIRRELVSAIADLEPEIVADGGIAGSINEVLSWLGSLRTELAAECERMFGI